MSFLESIRAKKNNLKLAETFVTYIDGKVFKESKDNSELVGKRYGFVVDNTPDKVPAKVTEYIYLGSQDCCEGEVLDVFKITHVLSVGVEAPVKLDDVSYKFVQCLDLPDTNLRTCLRECIPFIVNAESQCSNILVHCNAGVSRSSSIILGYLILEKGYSYVEAYNLVKTARNCIKPNYGFQKQLQCLV